MFKMNTLKQNIVNVINESQLNVEEVYYVMKDLMEEIINGYNQQLRQEKENKVVEDNKEENIEKEEEAINDGKNQED